MTRAELRADGDTLRLGGVVDFDSVPDLVEQAGAIAGSGFAAVDVTNVTRIDSAGAAFLVWLRKHHARDDGTLAVRGAPSQLTRLLEVTGLDAVLG